MATVNETANKHAELVAKLKPPETYNQVDHAEDVVEECLSTWETLKELIHNPICEISRSLIRMVEIILGSIYQKAVLYHPQSTRTSGYSGMFRTLNSDTTISVPPPKECNRDLFRAEPSAPEPNESPSRLKQLREQISITNTMIVIVVALISAAFVPSSVLIIPVTAGLVALFNFVRNPNEKG